MTLSLFMYEEQNVTTAVDLKGSHEPWLANDNIDAYATRILDLEIPRMLIRTKFKNCGCVRRDSAHKIVGRSRQETKLRFEWCNKVKLDEVGLRGDMVNPRFQYFR